MSKLQETLALYNQSRGEVLTLKKALTTHEEQLALAIERATAERDSEAAEVERAVAEAKARVAARILDAEAAVEYERAGAEVVRANLRRATSIMVQAATDVPRLLHSDMAGVVGKREREADQPEAEAAQ